MKKELAQELIDQYLKHHEPPEYDCIVYQYKDGLGYLCQWTFNGLKQFIEKCGTN